MIVRILGEGQFRIPDAEAHATLDAPDDAVESAVEAGDADALAKALQELHDAIEAHGVPVPDDELVDSDVIVPGTDATLDEVRELLSDQGLIPDSR